MLRRSFKRISVAIASALIALIAIAISWYIWSWDMFGLRRPTDSQLIALFKMHHAEFDRLREMGVDDSGVIRDINAATLASSSLPTQRRTEYLRLLSSIYPKLSLIVAPPSVTFVFTDGGTGVPLGPEWYKGIAYLPPGHEEGADIVDSLDKLPTDTAYKDYLVRVEPNWYLIFSKMD